MKNNADLFIVHSKGLVIERTLASELAKILISFDYSVWGYSDWKWETEIRETYSWDEGERIDPLRYALGQEPLGSKEGGDVDFDALEFIFRGTRVILVIGPTDGKPSNGVRDETWLINRQFRRSTIKGGGARRFIYCAVGDQPIHKIFSAINFSDTIRISGEANYQGSNNSPTSYSVYALALMIARHLWEQRWEQANNSLTSLSFDRELLEVESKKAWLLVNQLEWLPDNNDSGYHKLVEQSEVLVQRLNNLPSVPDEAIELADQLFELVEMLVEGHGVLDVRGPQGPWNLNGCRVRVVYYGPSGITRCLFVQFPEYEVALDLQVKGWVFLKKDEKRVYAQSLFSRTSNPRKRDSCEGDQAFYFEVGQRIMQLTRSTVSEA